VPRMITPMQFQAFAIASDAVHNSFDSVRQQTLDSPANIQSHDSAPRPLPSPSPPMQSKTADAFAIAPHAVQDRSLGPDACIHAFALTPCSDAQMPSQSPTMQSKTVALAPIRRE
jgi:hypothetical protein